eukprot:Em0004g288a
MSKTRSGLVYKEDDTKDTKDTMAELKVQELLQMLIEDRKKREMEISEERERRKKEFEAVRRSRGPEITVKLVPLNEKDDVEAYLVTFERIMAAHNISKDSGNYEKIKAAILIRYGINDEEYRRRFRSERRKDGETNRELAIRSCGYSSESQEHACVQAGELADEYEQARRPEMETLASSTSKPNRVGSRECHYCGKSGHAEEDCYKRKREESQRSRGIQCYHCKKQGHMSWECPEKSMVCKERMDWRRKGGKPMYKTGKVEGQKVTDILLDTGCSRTMVRRNLVAIEKVIVLEGSRQSPVHMETPNFIPLLSGGRTGWISYSGGSGFIRGTTCVCFVGNRCSRVNAFDKWDRIKHQLSKSRASDGGVDKSQSQAEAGRRTD